MINQMLDALQNKSARVDRVDIDENENFVIEFKSKQGHRIGLTVYASKKQALIINLDRETYIKQYIKEADLMAMIYYINEYGE